MVRGPKATPARRLMGPVRRGSRLRTFHPLTQHSNGDVPHMRESSARFHRRSVVAVAAVIAAASPAAAQIVVPAGFDDALVASVANPTAIRATPDGRLLIASQYGQLFVYQNGALAAAPILDLG